MLLCADFMSAGAISIKTEKHGFKKVYIDKKTIKY